MFREGSRKLGLNDYLVANAWAFDDFDGCLDLARNWNEDLCSKFGILQLPDDEVLGVCAAVMADLAGGKLVRTVGQRATARTDADEVRDLLATYENGAEAFALLMLLRAEHTARCLNGETFALDLEAMCSAQVMGNWAVKGYRKARETLLQARLIILVSEHGYRRAAQYRLGERRLTPSVARRVGR
jgi:hypothetical protein